MNTPGGGTLIGPTALKHGHSAGVKPKDASPLKSWNWFLAVCV